MSEICRFYVAHGVRFFLFAPALTIFSTCAGELNYVSANVAITYENGAVVNTGFVTNLGEWKLDNAPELWAAVKEQDDINRKKMHKELPKYDYPDNVVTPAQMAKLAKYGQHLQIKAESAAFVRALDAQKDEGKTIYGGGFLISDQVAEEKDKAERAAAERAAAERAAAERWHLSDRECEIISGLE